MASKQILLLLLCLIFSSNLCTNEEKIDLMSEKDCITSALYHEARGESKEGMLAIMSVIYNRTKSKKFPNSFCGVILQKSQFSYFVGKDIFSMLNVSPTNSIDKAAHDLANKIAEDVINNNFQTTLPEGTLYYAHKKVKNHWTVRFKRVKVIHQHVFYKEI